MNWWCRRGLHTWTDRQIAGVRDTDLGPMCSVTRACSRCPTIRHEQNRVLPRRWRGAA